MTPVKRYGLLLLGLVLGIKILLMAWGYSQFDFKKYPADTFISIWDRWDSQAYKTIAAEGYSPTNVAPDYGAFLSHFPPVYPLLIRIISTLSFVPVREAGFLISWIAILAASYVLYKLVFEVYGSVKIAFLAGLLLNVYPTSYFTIAPYTESLFLLLIIFSFYWLHQYPKQSYIAGIAGALAILTRLLGIAVIPAYIWFAWKKYRSGKLTVSDMFLVFLPFFALIVYFTINKFYFGEPLFFLHEYTINPFSAKTASWPFKETIYTLIAIILKAKEGIWDANLMNATGWNALFTLFALGATVWGIFKKIPFEYTVFSLCYLLLFSSFQWGISNARYSLALFPMFIALASTKNRYALVSIIIIFSVFLLYFTRLYTSGAWAF